MVDESKITVAFCITDSHVNYVFFTISMIAKYNNPYQFYIIHTDLTERSKRKLKQLETDRLSVDFRQVDREQFAELPLNLSAQGITVETYYRYVLPLLFPELDKLIYLDSDLLVQCNLRELWDVDVSDYYLAGVDELDVKKRFPDHKERLGFALDDLFVNAGVLVFNLKKMRDNQITDFLFSETLRLKEVISFQDQDVLNIALKGKILALPQTYNYTAEAMEQNVLADEAIGILHYNSHLAKPWKYENFSDQKTKRFQELWRKKMQETMQAYNPRVSVILPIYSGHYETAIEGVFAQRYGNLEMILVNHTSAERFAAIKEKLRGNPHVIYLDDAHQKPEERMKQALEEARGQYIFYVEEDHSLEPDCIEELLVLAQEENSDIVLTHFKTYDENNYMYFFHDTGMETGRIQVSNLEHALTLSFRNKHYLEQVFGKLFKKEWLLQKDINVYNNLFEKYGYTEANLSYVNKVLYLYRERKHERVSVIVPVYNVEPYLEYCLDSIVNQTYPNLEILLINDGSTDRSGEICEEYAQRDERIRVIHQENAGLSAARNTGLDQMTGDYVTFVDSDDAIDANFISDCYSYLKKYDADVTMTYYYRFSDATWNYYFYHNMGIDADRYFFNKEELMERIFDREGNATIPSVAKLFKATVFDTIRYPVGKLYEDSYVIQKIYLTTDKVVYLNQNSYMYRKREGSIMRSGYTNAKDLLCRLEYIEERLLDLSLANLDTTRAREEYIQFLHQTKIDLENNQLCDSNEYLRIINKIKFIK